MDVVLSEDVDIIMFGCGKIFWSWIVEGKGNVLIYIIFYDVEEIVKGESGLDWEGMVLVVLMSGGDYFFEGVLGCGIKVVCEVVRVGFGK